ncbi:Uncharacterised protein [uncultured Clostridium sp.]|nr:Uncharacterised protein [uncultured Clostridium sp.]
MRLESGRNTVSGAFRGGGVVRAEAEFPGRQGQGTGRRIASDGPRQI